MNPSDLIATLRDRQALTHEQVAAAAAWLLDLAVDAGTKADLLRTLAAKGETPAEIAGFVKFFLKHAIRPPLELEALGKPVIDVCGTGGDKLNLFNISTASMFVLAAGGVAVVKHGNRGITSKSGSADVLEALGVPVNLPPDRFAESVRETGTGFMLAPQYHPAFKAVAPVRAQLGAEGVRTIFNLIGPLMNPLQPPIQLVGVYDPVLPAVYAEIFRELGRQRAWAVHGSAGDGLGGMDEVSTLGPTLVVSLAEGVIQETRENLPLPVPALEELKGGDAVENAGIIKGILTGGISGAKRDIVLANAAAGFRVSGRAGTWEEGIALAQECIANGEAWKVVEKLRTFVPSAA